VFEETRNVHNDLWGSRMGCKGGRGNGNFEKVPLTKPPAKTGKLENLCRTVVKGGMLKKEDTAGKVLEGGWVTAGARVKGFKRTTLHTH